MRICKHGCDVTLSVVPEKYFIKAVEASSKHWGGGGGRGGGGWENSQKLCKPLV